MPTELACSERRFPAMGTSVHLIGVGGDDHALDLVAAAVDGWTRTAGLLDPTLPTGTRIDLGGIAKGHTADLVVADLARAGLAGACANIGGDVRVWGHAPAAASWTVDIGDPTGDSAPVAVLEIDDGAVVTSTRLRRRWLVNGADRHHLVDPRTGRSASNGWAQVSVVAGTATDAEVLSKALFVADDGHIETVGFGS